MLKYLKKSIKTTFEKRGYKIVNQNTYSSIQDFYKEVLIESRKSMNNEVVDSIVFSKDRALQLHAFLKSYTEKVDNYGEMFVLYKASNLKHKQSYEELKQLFNATEFIFIEEKDFRSQFIDIISKSSAKTIGLYVDDMIFLKNVDYSKIINIDTFEYIVSLSRGKDLIYSTVLEKKLDLPTFIEFENDMFSFSWNEIPYFSDWTYPLGVSGYFYGRDELFVMVNKINFKAPNSLESSMQNFIELFKNRKGICYETIACCCVHANIVQSEVNNPTLGEFTANDLLHKWSSGKQIDLNQFYDRDGIVAQSQKYTFTKR